MVHRGLKPLNQSSQILAIWEYRECKANGEIYKVSKYGAQDEHEFFAETFAMYVAEEE